MKVVGYYNSFARQDALSSLFVTPLTHINYAFLLPKENGDVYFYDEKNVEEVVKFAHDKGIKVFVSVGGFCDKEKPLSSTFEVICDNHLEEFILATLRVVQKYNFDGVDLDWEYPTKQYEKSFEMMVDKLGFRLHFLKKELSIAIHRAIEGEAKECRIVAISDKVIKAADWLNIMTYDATEDCCHSSLIRCMKSLDYWHSIRKVPRSKIMIGAAFYARPSAKLYCDLIKEDEKNYFRDYYKDDTFNGCYTIKEKTYFARFNCGGLIIWAINYDTFDKTSLLRVVNEAI